MVALALLCRDGTDGSAAAGLRRGGGVLDGMVSLCGRTGCRYMRNPAYGSAVAGTAERARAETLSGTSEACLSALPSETKKPLKTAAFSLLVPRTRLELTRANAHHPLKVACLPIPPPGPRFPPQRVFRCANIVTILFFPKYTAKKLPGHETDPAIRCRFRSMRRSRQRPARLLREAVYSAKSISSKR